MFNQFPQVSANKLFFAVHKETDGTLKLMIQLVEFLGPGLSGEIEPLFANLVLQLRQEHHLELLGHLQQELDFGVRSEVVDALSGGFVGGGNAANQVRAEGRGLQGLEPQEAELLEVVSLQDGV